MASKLNYSAALEQARMAQIGTQAGANAKLYLFSGTQPAGPGTTHSNTLIAGPFTIVSWATPTTALPSVLNMASNLPANVNASSTGQPTWWRVCKSTGDGSTDGVVDGSAGVADCDMTIGSCTQNLPVSITAWTMTSAVYGHS